MVSGVLMNARDQRFYLTSPASYREMIPDADVRKLARINSILFRPENAGRKVCLTLRRAVLYPAELQTHMVFRVPGVRKGILSPAVRCCQGVFPIAAARLFRQKALQSPAACGMLNLHGWISRKIE